VTKSGSPKILRHQRPINTRERTFENFDIVLLKSRGWSNQYAPKKISETIPTITADITNTAYFLYSTSGCRMQIVVLKYCGTHTSRRSSFAYVYRGSANESNRLETRLGRFTSWLSSRIIIKLLDSVDEFVQSTYGIMKVPVLLPWSLPQIVSHIPGDVIICPRLRHWPWILHILNFSKEISVRCQQLSVFAVFFEDFVNIYHGFTKHS
jgi:hypothetical protein